MPAPKLLIIEDDPFLQTLLLEVFCGAGYQVAAAMPDDCLAQARQFHPEIVVVACDGRGSFEPGWQVAETLHREFASTPFVMLSTNSKVIDEVTHGSSRGSLFDAALCKPFSLVELLRIVETCREGL